MKKRLYRALKCAGWSCVAAGTLGLVRWTVAQAPLAPRGTGRTDAATVPAGERPEHSKLVEYLVQLAWYEDPATFAYVLGAKLADGPALEVRGFVPNEQVRQKALRVAREQSGLPLVDNLKVNARIAPRNAGRPVGELKEAVLVALKETFPQHAGNWEVRVHPSGRVLVAGATASYEDKLAVSQRLRRVSGCTSVENQLTLASVLIEGRAYSWVTADGRQLVPESGNGPGVVIPTQGTMIVETVPTPAPAAVRSAASLKPTIEPPVLQAPPVAPPAAPAATPRKIQVTGKAETAPALSQISVPLPRPAAVTTTQAPVAASTATATPTIKQTTENPLRRPVTPPPPVAPAAARPATTPQAPRTEKSRAPDKPYVTTGTILKEVEPVAAPDKPYVTTGVVLMDNGAAATPQAPPISVSPPTGPVKQTGLATGVKTNLTSLETRVKNQIQAACGNKIRDVVVRAESGKDLKIHFKVRNEKDGEAAFLKITQLPELAPYKADIDAEVVP